MRIASPVHGVAMVTLLGALAGGAPSAVQHTAAQRDRYAGTITIVDTHGLPSPSLADGTIGGNSGFYPRTAHR